ncbi:MAG: aminopeptidase [Lachnospiraceae bacterium]|nr:aminopeptidase [Lachnospiraceae bacterium]
MKSIFFEKTEELEERYELVTERIRELPRETVLYGGWKAYFTEVAEYLYLLEQLYQDETSGKELTLSEYEKRHDRLFDRFREGNYERSFLDPDFACQNLGRFGGVLSAVYADITGLCSYAAEGRLDLITVFSELVSQLYGIASVFYRDNQEMHDDNELFDEIHTAIHDFYHDYQDVFAADGVIALVNPENRFFTDIIENSDLSKPDYMYKTGLFVGEDQRGIQKFLSETEPAKIKAMADTFTEGYKKGFDNTGRDMSKKETVLIEYCLGFELMIKEVMNNFKELGLRPVIKRESLFSFDGRGAGRKYGCYSTGPGRQFEYDHRDDRGYYFDKGYIERRLEVLRDTYEKNKEWAGKMAGPALMEVFGEPDFLPVNKESRYTFTEKQNQLQVSFTSKAGQIGNTYIPEEETSFSIISYPLPGIGADFEKIFEETVKINTLDYVLYQTMQQKIIDILDKGEKVHILGQNGNETDITVALCPLKDPEKETIFENCVADVNIPVGEVFTSPKLEGTNGVLHVSRVYLNNLSYKDLKLTFKDGIIKDYTCKNFEEEQENRKLIYDNILYKHEFLPLGEFAIGTNTTAYIMGRKYGIESKLPILIAEKTGPHFAVGDTCYSHAEDVAVYNPDGKEIIARSNTFADKRDEDPEKAYFNCHTDITIPYEELGEIAVITKEGERIPVIKDGKFVVPGTEELNKPLEENI